MQKNENESHLELYNQSHQEPESDILNFNKSP